MERLLYQKLLQWKASNYRKPLLLQGTRQVGKTYLLKEFGSREFKQAHYINFEKGIDVDFLFKENFDVKRIIENISIILDKEINIEEDLLIFDEIQECPKALTSLKYFNEDMKELALCCAGSHIGVSLSKESFPVGQVDFLNLFPMNFEEFIMAVNKKKAELLAEFSDETVIPEVIHRQLWRDLKIYYITGGMPEAVKRYIDLRENQFEAFKNVRVVQEAILEGYRSDFAKHAGKENAAHINRVFDNVPVQLSRNIDASVQRYRFKGVIPNKSKFVQLEGPIDWLLKSGLIIKVFIVNTPVLPLKNYSKDNIFKLYLFDTGLLGCMQGLPFDSILNQDYGRYKGYYAENFVAQEFVAAGCGKLFSWVGKDSEIEFLRVIDNRVVPVEVKSGARTKAKSLLVYKNKYSPQLQVKITANNLQRENKQMHHYPLYLAGKIKHSARTASWPP
ncbi:MAG: AAA family ATPase [Candidatus Aminicenantes bacterium]|nr:AAA family ATPase [Candidatus Aminicenantes bacterium]NIM83500.1 AAA family ATPase [Candidatus Aminicenantes bacterium]NIN22889.1 AAA family ATPase [Candidatus Aminicenantes bacterium]NIN46628.1 AAA family ATPase [Candidatus Aminicenantes bacterium]NIN89531.1 AAA family ATPase [Candidatus Aminicenantes bacterium]